MVFQMKKPKWVFDGRGIAGVKEMDGLCFKVEAIGRAGTRSRLQGMLSPPTLTIALTNGSRIRCLNHHDQMVLWRLMGITLDLTYFKHCLTDMIGSGNTLQTCFLSIVDNILY
jgi:hypothetical protein